MDSSCCKCGRGGLRVDPSTRETSSGNCDGAPQIGRDAHGSMNGAWRLIMYHDREVETIRSYQWEGVVRGRREPA